MTTTMTTTATEQSLPLVHHSLKLNSIDDNDFNDTPPSSNMQHVQTVKEDQNNASYIFRQHQNVSSGSLNEPTNNGSYYNSNFEVANRAFYATINKFTRQNSPDASRRRSPPYSFLENWHLHSMYSKSQQTLLGITPVRPSVILSGDDFMFTPPFIQQEIEDYDEEEDYLNDDDDEYDEDWEDQTSRYYNLSPCPVSANNEAGQFLFYDEEEPIQSDDDEEEINMPPASALFDKSTSFIDEKLEIMQQQQLEQEERSYFNSLVCDQDYYPSLLLENSDDRRPHSLNGFESVASNPELLHIDTSPASYLTQQRLKEDIILDMALISPSHDVPELSPSSISSDEQDQAVAMNDSEEQDNASSTHSLINLFDNTFPSREELNRQQDVTHIAPMTRSSSHLSQKSVEDTSSVMSYQSLADLIPHTQSTPTTLTKSDKSLSQSYGSIDSHTITTKARPDPIHSLIQLFVPHKNNTDDGHQTSRFFLFGIMFVCVMYLWQFLVQFVERVKGRMTDSSSTRSEIDSLL
ncbi:MAG: hypothetical protein EXX96DRAFT_587873 [Benjaminiella poitrasii]|nr:MAG: hypothetical protein EXX96DRAFT_587873 [Benjaminiella poitrasii]